jgi:excinuclease ABC subunit A
MEQDITSPNLTLAEGALLPWQNHPYYSLLLDSVCRAENIDIMTPWKKLTEKERKKILYGVPGYFEMAYVTKHSDGKIHRSKYE